ncbi:MAG TPA: hypothetical protein VLV25_04495 [Steroidobacteraceae bacterium]|nr:hypothetical protein [Steroidobacteraceae bacterium]
MAEEDAATVARFKGAVSCARRSRGPLRLTLTGRTADHPDEEIQLAFAGAAPADLPDRLEDAVVERGRAGEYRIASAMRAWTVAARSVHLHREVAERFYRAIPPRRAPLMRRLAFGVMLRLARSRAGIALIRALRR